MFHDYPQRLCMRCACIAVLGFALFSSPRLVAMDRVRQQTGTDAAVAKYGVSGAGVVVAILDRGLDYTHPDFIRPDGNTRIKWLLDMSNAGPNPCDPNDPPPVEYSEAQINAALHGGPLLPTRDAVGHGTVTTGLAAGNGRAFADGKYRGMAPQADLIIVKITSDGVPEHDGQAAEAFFQGCNTLAWTWLNQKLALLGEPPCVALINSGVLWGPNDGTSIASREIEQFAGPSHPGRIYVAAAGDEGGLPTHAGGTFTDTADTVIGLNKSTADPSTVFVWYTGTRPANVTITFDDGTTVGPVGPDNYYYDPIADIYVVQYTPGTEFYGWTSDSGDRVAVFYINGHATTGAIRMRGLTTGAGHFDAYKPGRDDVAFTDHLVTGHLTDYSCSRGAIVNGAHVVRTEYDALDGGHYNVNDEGEAGQFWAHSGEGPTRDGRWPGVDLTAPGHNAFAAYSRTSFWATFTFNEIADGGGWYGRAGATSGSAPIMVGAIALMLELCPTLTADQARAILHATATADANTGPVPNIYWGYGKLNVFAALDALNAANLGDFDCSGRVDQGDLPTFVNVLLGLDANLLHMRRADTNNDGTADGGDIDGFVRRLLMP